MLRFLVMKSIRRGNFAKYLFLGAWSPRKSYRFLQNFEKALGKFDLFIWYFFFLENLICVLTKFWTRSPKIWSVLMLIFLLENLMCLWNFEKALLEILMCFSTYCFSWKTYMCSCAIFDSLLENSYVFFEG